MRHRLAINAVPILGDFVLRLFESKTPRANLRVQIAFDSVFGMRTPVRDGRVEWFGPEISGVGGIAAQFERNEMVLLVILQPGIRVAVFRDLLDFQPVRVTFLGPHEPGAPSGIANRFAYIFLRNLRIHRARSSGGIGINIRRTQMRQTRLDGNGRIRGRGPSTNPPDDDNRHDDGHQKWRDTFLPAHRFQFNPGENGRAYRSGKARGVAFPLASK